MKKFKLILPYIVILILAFFLRAYRYWEFPTKHETADEIAWTWLGSSILQDGQPTSWSFFHSYGDGGYIYTNGPLRAPLVRPVVDHPPLFSFIPGMAHLSTEAHWITEPDRKIIRIPMLFIGTLAVALFAYWTSQVLEKKWSLLASFIYAVIPTFVFSSRLVIAENLLIIWILCTGILLHYWEHIHKNKTRNQSHLQKISGALIFLSIVSILTKISGILVPVVITSYALIRKDYKLIKIGVFALTAAVLSLLLYAKAINFELFMAVQAEQAARPIGLATLYNRFFIHPNVTRDIYYDGWIIIGLFGFIYTLIKKELTKQNAFWLFSLLSCIATLGFIGISGGEYTFYGWYSYPLFPFLALFITTLIKEAYSKKYLLTGVLWFFLLPGISLMISFMTRPELLSKDRIRVLYFLGFLPLLLSLTPLKKYAQHTQIFLFGILILTGMLTVLSVDSVAVDLFQASFWYELTK